MSLSVAATCPTTLSDLVRTLPNAEWKVMTVEANRGRWSGLGDPITAAVGGRSASCVARGSAGLGTTPETSRRGHVYVLDPQPLTSDTAAPAVETSPAGTDGAR